jgi:hypothetical protein
MDIERNLFSFFSFKESIENQLILKKKELGLQLHSTLLLMPLVIGLDLLAVRTIFNTPSTSISYL